MDASAIKDVLAIAPLIALMICVPKLRKPILWLFAAVFLVILGDRIFYAFHD